VHTHKRLGQDIHLADLRKDYDAVFIGAGLGAVQALGIDGEEIDGLHSAVDYIARLRQTEDMAALAIGRRVVVIGGGSTAIDIAVKSKRLGAEDVTLVYRRGPDAMSATAKEQEFAQTNGVTIRHWMKPVAIMTDGGAVAGIEFEYTKTGADGNLAGTGETVTLEADMVFKAIGQIFVPDPVSRSAVQLELNHSKIAVDGTYATSLDGVFAGGDCIDGNIGLTVAAVQDGKRAAAAINDYLATK